MDFHQNEVGSSYWLNKKLNQINLNSEWDYQVLKTGVVKEITNIIIIVVHTHNIEWERKKSFYILRE